MMSWRFLSILIISHREVYDTKVTLKCLPLTGKVPGDKINGRVFHHGRMQTIDVFNSNKFRNFMARCEVIEAGWRTHTSAN